MLNTTKCLRNTLFLFLLILGYTAEAQISFEKGYFIDNSGTRTECLIRNVDWMKNPSSFDYKLSESEEVQSADVSSVSEFSVENQSKYIRAAVLLDRASNELKDLGMNKVPNLKEELLFLKVLAEGDGNLYVYEESYKRNYFYSTAWLEIKPLIYKRYIKASNEIAENNQYRQQLWNGLSMLGAKRKEIANLDYKQTELTIFFNKINGTSGNLRADGTTTEKKDLFNVTLRPGIRNAFLTLQNANSNANRTVYDDELNVRIGAEFEIVLPFNKNKWALLAEPAYQYYITEKPLRLDSDAMTVVGYRTFETSFGARHYMFLNEKSKLFINASMVLAFNTNSGIDDPRGFTQKLANSSNAAVGLGYKFKDTYGVEFNYNLNRGLFKDPIREAVFQSFSLIFGYKLF